MGEVYRARDPRLERDVAIKVLPEALSADPDRLRRFEQEARAAAALNHPHILSVFDIGSHDGAPYIVSELLDGETLYERLARGPLVIDAAVTLALEIADALDAAHARGLIHRDIKPSNLFLTSRGAKLLDFGVAKPVGPTPSHSGDSDPTRPVEAPLTEPGITIGTVAYMSPEQVRGEPLDARSDLFSVGLVLYEMTTGQRAFPAGKSADLAAAILKDTPVPPRRLRPELPASLEHIILKALEKDREFRYHSAAELRTDLRRLQRDSGAEPAISSTTAGVVATPGASRRLGLVASMAAGVAVVAALLYVTRDRDRPSTTSDGDVSPALDRMQVTRLTTSGTAERPAVSPDGKYVVYVQRDREGDSLWIRQTATSSNVQIVAPRAGVRLYGSTVTPDGTFVDVVRRQAGQQPQLWRVPFLGGQGKPVIDGVWSPIGWSPDGQRLAFVRAASERGASYLMIADRDGANVRTLVTVTRPAVLVSMSLGIESAARPAWSPDGQSIAVATYQTDATRLLLAGATTGATRFIELSRTVPFWGVEWSSGDTLLVSSPEDTATPSQLWYVSVADGRVSRATNDINNYQGVGMTADRNSLVTSRSETRTGIWIGDGSARQGIEAVRSQVGASFSVSVAWAGDHLLYASTAEGRSTIMSVGPGGEQQEVVANGNQPAATSNGATIVYNSSGARVQDSSLFNARLNMDGSLPGIWRVDAGSGPAVKLARGMAAYLQVTKDDRSVMYISAENGLQSPWIMSLDGGTPRQVANVWAGNFDISPDGRRLAIESRDERARSTVLICELPACADPRPWPTGDRIRPGRLLRWTPDGRGLAYISSAGSNVWVQPLDGRRATQLTGFTDGAVIGDFAWSRDGKRLAVSRSTTTNDIVLFTGLKR